MTAITSLAAGRTRQEGAAGDRGFAGLALGLAHDFRNLLFVVSAHAYQLRQTLPDGDVRRDDVDAIVAAAGRAEGLTRQLLDAGRGVPPTVREVDLNAIVKGLDELLLILVGPTVTVTTDLEDGLWPLHANATQLEQVVMNLAANAHDAMPAGGTLCVRTRNERDGRRGSGGRVVLEVSDTGHGMSPEVKARVFEPYFTTRGAAGTGVGLATVHAIVAGCGGAIDVESAPGAGTTFRVALPAARVPPLAKETRSGTPAAPATHRVLLVDDDPAVRALLTCCLEAEGYELVVAGSGEEALALCLQTEKVLDLVVTDLNLPGVPGTVVAERLRERTPELPVVFISGSPEQTMDVADVRRASALHKPFSLAEFNQTVRSALDTRAA